MVNFSIGKRGRQGRVDVGINIISCFHSWKEKVERKRVPEREERGGRVAGNDAEVYS